MVYGRSLLSSIKDCSLRHSTCSFPREILTVVSQATLASGPSCRQAPEVVARVAGALMRWCGVWKLNPQSCADLDLTSKPGRLTGVEDRILHLTRTSPRLTRQSHGRMTYNRTFTCSASAEYEMAEIWSGRIAA